MSTELVVEVPDGVPRAIVKPADDGTVWDPEPPRWLCFGRYQVFRPWVSTRATQLDYTQARLAVTVHAGACREDWDLALAIVRAAARYGTGVVRETEVGTVALEQLDVVFGDEWKRSQLASAARVTMTLAEDGSVIALPGPVREVWIGPRMLAELKAAEPAAADHLVTIMRRTLWPDPRYFPAMPYVAPGPTGEPYTFVMVPPGVPCVLPHSDKVGFDDGWGPALVPRERLAELPVTTTFLDERNQLVEWIDPYEWPRICAQARAIATS